MTNELRMPFAEWLVRMSIANISAAGRSLAIYATVLDVTGNDDLARIINVGSRTLDKLKKELSAKGWVTISRRKGGRGIGIVVTPAVDGTPVQFTDLSRRDLEKMLARIARNTPANPAGVDDAETPAENTPAKNTPLSSLTPANPAGVPARAYKESPPEISSYEREGESASRHALSASPMQSDKPHMNGVGFVISEKHGLFIDSETIAKWRDRFPHIPDLEAQMEKLSTVILSRGRMHPGWECPSGWMAGCLAKDNKQAETDAQIAAARIAKASGAVNVSREDAKRKIDAILGRRT